VHQRVVGQVTDRPHPHPLVGDLLGRRGDEQVALDVAQLDGPFPGDVPRARVVDVGEDLGQ
jgi:hypothetical protein